MFTSLFTLCHTCFESVYVAELPVQQFPILSTPAVFELFCVHPSNFIKIWFINSKQAKAVYLPVTLETKEKHWVIQFDGAATGKSDAYTWLYFKKYIYYTYKIKVTYITVTGEWVSVPLQTKPLLICNTCIFCVLPSGSCGELPQLSLMTMGAKARRPSTQCFLMLSKMLRGKWMCRSHRNTMLWLSCGRKCKEMLKYVCYIQMISKSFLQLGKRSVWFLCV